MKIAVIGTLGIPASYGGVEKQSEELYTRLARRGHDITVYCRNHYVKHEVESYNGVKLKRFPSIKTKHFDTISHSFLSTLDSILRKYELVHFQSIGSAPLSILPKLNQTQTVVTVHSLDWKCSKWNILGRRYLQLAERMAMRFPAKVISVSKTIKQYLEKEYNKDVFYIQNGISAPDYIAPDNLSRFGLVPNNYLLFVGRLVPEKGCHHLLDAFNRISTQMKLVIVGGSRFSTSYISKLKASAKNPNIIFLDYQPADVVAELYEHAYLCVFPSESEGQSICLLEAMSHGKSVLVSDIPENLEVIDGCGFAFESKNSTQLKDRLQKILELPELVANMGQKAREHILNNYSWDFVADEYERVFSA
jgi:glycosyltransferase involved in cell wall biosynthesis